MGAEGYIERRRTRSIKLALQSPLFLLVFPNNLLVDRHRAVMQAGGKDLSKLGMGPGNSTDERGVGLYLFLKLPLAVNQIPDAKISIGRRRYQPFPIIVKSSIADEFTMA